MQRALLSSTFSIGEENKFSFISVGWENDANKRKSESQ
jgi:hypothetical protein